MAAAAPAGSRPASEIPTWIVWSPGTEPAGASVSMPLNTAEGSGAVGSGGVTVEAAPAILPTRAPAAAAAVAAAWADVFALGVRGSAPGAVAVAPGAPVVENR